MPLGTGAVAQFDNVRFGGPTRPQETHVAVTTVNATIVSANPDRVMLMLTNNGPDILWWSTKMNQTDPNVFKLGVGQMLVFQVQDDGAVCASQIIGAPSIAQCEIQVLELIRDREG